MTNQDYSYIDDKDKAECRDRIVDLPRESASEMIQAFLRRQAVQFERCRSAAWKNAAPAFTSRLSSIEGDAVTLRLEKVTVPHEMGISEVCRVTVNGSMIRLGSDSLHVIARLKVAAAADSDGSGTCLAEIRPGLSQEHEALLHAHLKEIGAYHRAPTEHVCAACNTRRARNWLSVVLDRETSRMYTMGSDCEELVVGLPQVSPFKWEHFCRREGHEREDRIDPQPVFFPTAFKAELVLSIYHELYVDRRSASDLLASVTQIKSPHERFAKMARSQMARSGSWFNRQFIHSPGLNYDTLAEYVSMDHPLVRQLCDPQNRGYLPITTRRELKEHAHTIKNLLAWANNGGAPKQSDKDARKDLTDLIEVAERKGGRVTPWVLKIWANIDAHKAKV